MKKIISTTIEVGKLPLLSNELKLCQEQFQFIRPVLKLKNTNF